MNDNIKDTERFRREDRDLLLELKIQVQNIRNDIKELKDNTTVRIKCLESDKADRKEVEELQKKVNDDIEKRVINLEISVDRFETPKRMMYGLAIVMLGILIKEIVINTIK